MANGWFRARCHWLDAETGKRGVWTERKSETGPQTLFMDSDEPPVLSDFMWTEGNYACDCNRALFFLGGGSDDVPCTETRFIIGKLEALEVDSDDVVKAWESYEKEN